jgi:glucosamine--fructose-6-phosphate aminotransferase (isomerizing)
MCGIVGYIGKNKAYPILIDGLKRLEYRGYDSAGFAILNSKIVVEKSVGKIIALEEKVGGKEINGHLGIAHTRWATHGQPTIQNAHPHSDCSGKIWIVHNGIIENYRELKEYLEKKGHIFKSETDSEVVAHLLEDIYEGDLTGCVIRAKELLKGTYGLVIMHQDEPEKLIAARCGSPLVIGLSENENIIASDVSAIIKYTKQVVYLNDGEVAEIKSNNIEIFNGINHKVEIDVKEIEWDIAQAEKGGYDHFMLKEIMEQPETVNNAIRGRLIIQDGKAKLGGLDSVADKLRGVRKIFIVACGTAYHAGRVGEYMLEEYANTSTEVDYASEFRYRKAPLGKHAAVVAISQSGETADTLAAVREAKEKGAVALGIVNVVGSTIARETDAGVYNHSGPEIAVASTKAFVSQLSIMALLTIFLGRQRDMSVATGKRIGEEINLLPDKIKKILESSDEIKKIAAKYLKYNNFAFLGRKYNQPVSFEGALKLKELSYVHAEGFASGEMKHGPIAMIDDNFPSMFIAPEDSVYEKNISNMQEIKARNGKIIVITTEGNTKINDIADDIIYIPKTLEMLTPILSVIPLQLFAYHFAVLRGCDVDKPRNLAKSVTVE